LMPAPAASIVVPTRNRGDLIMETIDSLLKLEGVDFEVVVVDQSTDERTAAAVAAAANGDPRVRVVRTTTVGSSAARNVGALHAAGHVVAYTDDDCLVEPDWLELVREDIATLARGTLRWSASVGVFPEAAGASQAPQL